MFLMSAWSIGVMIDRYIAFNGAQKQSKAFAPAVAGALRDGNLADGWTVRIYYNPLVVLIWIGALIIFAGGIISTNTHFKKIRNF